MTALPPRPSNVVFRIRVVGKVFNIGFNNLQEAEQAAHGHIAPRRLVEIIDGVTGQLIKRL